MARSRPVAPRPTIGDIAARAGVSKTAVSFALNGKDGLSEATRERILQVADELNWRPLRAAQALNRNRFDMVGLVFARPARTLGVEPFFAQLISGLQSTLSTDAIGLQLLIVEDLQSEIEVYRQWASEDRVHGLVITDVRAHDPRFPMLAKLDLPAVVIGGDDGLKLPSVWVDDHAAMSSIVEYLVALGHRRIGHVAGKPEFLHTQARDNAIRSLAKGRRLEITTVHTDFSDAEGATATRSILASRQRPTAMIYDSDVMAVAGLGVAMEMGVSVPEQVSIVSFDDSVLTQRMHPALSALTRDTFALGNLVAATLLEVMAGTATLPRVQAPTPRLVVRQSTAVVDAG
ncbi:LacI family DNA-binding transcriptional regulator [Microlunatus sp. GCM10028923]|uniref:LacI family DNA-binding transcriptional regulator n=1 Tax=Microlunatus sp. GCM10028923 TaxID=3273400 RepID=UPI00360FA609